MFLCHFFNIPLRYKVVFLLKKNAQIFFAQMYVATDPFRKIFFLSWFLMG